MAKRILNMTAEEMTHATKSELIEAIAGSEGRVLASETIGITIPLLTDVTNAEFAASMGADLILLNMFDVQHPVINALPEVPETETVRELKRLTGRVIGINLEPCDPEAAKSNDGTLWKMSSGRLATVENARRAAVVHLMFNVIGVVVLLTVYCVVKALFAPAILDRPATMYGIAIAHSVFNILCTAMLLPAGGLLEKLAIRLVPDAKRREETVELDSRLLATPALALGRARDVTVQMAQCAVRALENALDAFTAYTPELARSIRKDEERCDHYEDIIGRR